MGKNSGRAGAARSRVNQAVAGNERMDRRAGGPVRWDKFYGTTAEKFFYHPTDNHTYHTRTILRQTAPSRDNQTGPGVPSRQGLPTHQRPPQFDYIYRANQTAKARATAEISKIANKVDMLDARRQQLELEQGKLWCEVAFRAVAKNDLDRKPLYRFAPRGSEKDDLLAATTFVVAALSIIENGQKDQASTFAQMKPFISSARDKLGDTWLKLGVDYRDESTDRWRFAALARRLEDVSSNLSDSYRVSVDSAANSDPDRRDMYRGLLQRSLVQYAETVLALDEMASELAKASDFEADLKQVLEPTQLNISASPIESQVIPESGYDDTLSMNATSPISASPESVFNPNTVWVADPPHNTKLTVLHRNANRFTARFESAGWIREINGTVKNDSVTWLGKDVRVIKGSAGDDNFGRIVTERSGYRIDFEWRGRNERSRKSGSFVLRLAN